MLAEVIITNVHKHNFAFGHAVEPINEQVFIPAHVTEGLNLKPSDIVEATLVPNYADKSNSGTKYMAVKVSLLNTPELNMIDSVETSQEVDFNQVEAEVYGRVGLQRPTFLMWAKEANRFIDFT